MSEEYNTRVIEGQNAPDVDGQESIISSNQKTVNTDSKKALFENTVTEVFMNQHTITKENENPGKRSWPYPPGVLYVKVQFGDVRHSILCDPLTKVSELKDKLHAVCKLTADWQLLCKERIELMNSKCLADYGMTCQGDKLLLYRRITPSSENQDLKLTEVKDINIFKEERTTTASTQGVSEAKCREPLSDFKNTILSASKGASKTKSTETESSKSKKFAKADNRKTDKDCWPFPSDVSYVKVEFGDANYSIPCKPSMKVLDLMKSLVFVTQVSTDRQTLYHGEIEMEYYKSLSDYTLTCEGDLISMIAEPNIS